MTPSLPEPKSFRRWEMLGRWLACAFFGIAFVVPFSGETSAMAQEAMPGMATEEPKEKKPKRKTKEDPPPATPAEPTADPATTAAPAAAGTVDMTASELAKAAKDAASSDDFAIAAARLAQLETEYGANEATKPLLEELRPLMAMCHVRAERHAEALEQLEASLKVKTLDAKTRDELTFWRAVTLLRTGSVEQAQMALGEYFANEKNDRRQRYEAFLLFGAGYLQLEDAEGAVAFFAEQLPKLPQDQRDVTGRATVLYLHALTEAGKLKTAVQTVREVHATLPEMPQVISFHSLTLNLGAKLLEEGKYYDAVACLQRVWSREALVAHQRERLAAMAQRREELKAEGQRHTALLQLNSMITSIERELTNFEAIESFDAALRLRLAQAWLGLERPLQAALILEDMLQQLPPDAVVQQAAITLLRCWLQQGRWDKAQAAANLYLEKFPPQQKDAGAEEALFSKAEASRGDLNWAAAEEQFQEFVEQWPDSPFAPQAVFLTAMCQLSRDDAARGIMTLHELQKGYPKHELAEDAEYWIGMGWSFEKDHAAAREQLQAYLKKHPEGRYQEDAAFSVAQATFNLMEHEPALVLFDAFAKKYPESPRLGQMLLLKGESLLALGRSIDAVETLKQVAPTAEPFFTEAWFKAGEALKRMERWAEMREHYAGFISKYPTSPRLAEAVFLATRADVALGEPEKARDRSWRTIESLANNPAAQGIEELLLSLVKFHPGADGRSQVISKLHSHAAEAEKAQQTAAAVRYGWAALKLKMAPDEGPANFVLLGSQIDPSRDHPRILADVADGYHQQQAFRVARQHYQALRRWHPRSLEKERASLGLAQIALAENKVDEAKVELDRCLKECLTTTVEATAVLAKARLLVEPRPTKEEATQAVPLLQNMVNSRFFPNQQRAEGQLLLGQAWEALKEPAKAADAYARCYLSFGKFRTTAALGYLRHSRLLKKQKDTAAALALLKEALALPHLQNPSDAALQDAARELRKERQTLEQAN